jgi:hypothetical protein
LRRNGSRVLLTSRVPLAEVDALAEVATPRLTHGLDDSNGTAYVSYVAGLKKIDWLAEPPRVKEGRVEDPGVGLTRRLSGHPRVISLALPDYSRPRNWPGGGEPRPFRHPRSGRARA